MDPLLAQITPPGGPWYYGFKPSIGHVGSVVAVTRQGDTYWYGTKSVKEGYRWRCSACKDLDGYGWCFESGLIVHVEDCKVEPSSFKDAVRKWAALMVIHHLVNCPDVGNKPAIFRRWQFDHGNTCFEQWKLLMAHVGISGEDRVAWDSIMIFVEKMVLMKTKRLHKFGAIIAASFIRMTAIASVNLEQGPALERVARNMPVPEALAIVNCDKDAEALIDQLNKFDEKSDALDALWRVAIDKAEEHLEAVRQQAELQRKRRAADREKLVVEYEKTEEDLGNLMDLVGQVDEPTSPPAKRRKRNRQPKANAPPVTDDVRPGEELDTPASVLKDHPLPVGPLEEESNGLISEDDPHTDKDHVDEEDSAAFSPGPENRSDLPEKEPGVNDSGLFITPDADRSIIDPDHLQGTDSDARSSGTEDRSGSDPLQMAVPGLSHYRPEEHLGECKSDYSLNFS